MKFSIDPADLKEAVRFAQTAIAHHPLSPIMGGILLNVGNGRMTASGSDYSKVSTLTVPANSDEPIELLLRGDYLNKSAAKFKTKKDVMVTVEEKRVTLAQGGIKFTIPRMPVAEYPTDLVGAARPIGSINGEDFAKLIKQASVSASRDFTLAVLTAVHVVIGDNVQIMSTDRYRLSLGSADWDRSSEDTFEMSVDGEWIKEVAKTVAGDTELFVCTTDKGVTNRFGVTSGGYTTSVQLAAGEYPKIRQLFTNHAPEEAYRLNRDELISALDAVTVMLEQNSPVILENADCEMRIWSSSENGDSSVNVETDQDEPIKFGVNPTFLLEILRTMHSDEIVLSPHETKPMHIGAQGDRAEHLIMPVRLQN